jgi:hypothetical protein
VVLGRELGDCIAQREKRTNCNDASAKSLQIGEGSAHSRSSTNDIVHYRDAFTFDGWLQSSRETVLDRI